METALHRPTIAPYEFRTALGRFASGLTVITGQVDETPVGFTCQAFYSVSTEPPLVSFSVMLTSTSWPRIRDTGRFAVNLLAHDQHDVAGSFARSGTDKWSGIEWHPSNTGNPLINGGLSWIDCVLHDEYQAGDHYIVIGHVEDVSPPGADEDERPLIYYKGNFRQLS